MTRKARGAVKAVIMAGGEGTRLRPLTSLRPKPMVPIVNQPVMEHIVGLVKHHGIDDVVATLQFMPRVIEDHFGDGEEWSMNISYAVEETPLGTAGSVKNASDALDGTFLVISGDALTDIDLTKVVDFHRSHGGLVTVALKRVPDPLEFGVVITAEDGRIERFVEKPTWGQVFSDTINTGIYVLEPEIFDYIPSREPFDFASQLFPLLMKKGFDLYGCIVDGYWCDIGSLGTYVQAQRDILDGKANLFIPGVKARRDIWIGEGADVHPDAVLGEKVVIGANTRVRAGARIGDYSVIGDNCLVGFDAHVEHSIVWSDSFVGAGSAINGAVLCRRVDIRSRARVEMGAAIGDESMVGHGAVVGNDVQVYPFKRIEPGAVLASSLIWESKGMRNLFGADGVAGLVSVDVTPEMALRLAQAFGTILPNGGHVVASRDSSRAARMIKRAIVAGLNSACVNVRDLRVVPPSINRFTTRDTRCVGGVHVCASHDDAQTLEIHFFDKLGLDIVSWDEKKIERLYFREEFRRSFFEEVGDIIYPPRAMEYYGAGMNEALLASGCELKGRPKVVIDLGFGAASFVLPQVAAKWGIEVLTLDPFDDAERTYVGANERDDGLERLRSMVDTFQADLGVATDSSAERLRLVTPSGWVLDGDTALHAMIALWCACDTTGLGVAVPVSASRVVERIAGDRGRAVVRCGRSRRALSTMALRDDVGFAGSQTGGYVFPRFLAAYDAMMSLGMLVRMLDHHGGTLDDVVAELPPFRLVEKPVFCPDDRKGAVMRAVAESVTDQRTETEEGIRVVADDGWSLVLPHAALPLVRVFAEGDDEQTAERLASHFAAIVEHAVAEGR